MSSQWNEQEKQALEFLDTSPLHKQALTSCKVCGLTTLPFLEHLSRQVGIPGSRATIRRALKSLAATGAGYPALLDEYSIKIEGRSGAGTFTYIPTAFGRRLLTGLGIDLPEVNTPALRGHRYIQLEIYLHALKAGAEVEMEKVLPYNNGRRNVRVDVLAAITRELGIRGHYEEDRYLFEAEQVLPSSNATRALEKVRNWQAYGLPGEYPKIVIVFNVPTKNLERTMNIWREALQSLEEELTFRVCSITLNQLLELPLRDAVREFGVALDPEYGMGGQDEADVLSPFARQVRAYQPDMDLELDFQAVLEQWRDADTPARRVAAFFALMRCIHQASDLSESGDAFLYNQLPIESLGLLYRYLTLEENQSLYDDLRQAIHWMQGRNLGVTLLREVNTQVIWDVFLAHHGFARGGKLQVAYEIADHLEKFVSFGAVVFYHGSKYSGSQDTHPDDAALAWVLTALFVYAEPLGLGRLPWKKKPKGGDA